MYRYRFLIGILVAFALSAQVVHAQAQGGERPTGEESGDGGWYSGNLQSGSYSLGTDEDDDETASLTTTTIEGSASGGDTAHGGGGGRARANAKPMESDHPAAAPSGPQSPVPMLATPPSPGVATAPVPKNPVHAAASSFAERDDFFQGGILASSSHFNLVDEDRLLQRWILLLVMLSSVATGAGCSIVCFWLFRLRPGSPRRRKPRRVLAAFGLALILVVTVPSHVKAENTVPSLRAYNGTLRGSNGSAVTTAVKIRFSYWKSQDYVTTDTTATGAINAGSANFMHWQEVHSVTPSSKGTFSVSLGSVETLLNLKNVSSNDITNLALQVEVKAASAADTSYELLDSNPSPTIDRSRLQAVPFARNADLLDRHDTGTGSSDIPVLNSSGQLLFSTIPGGTNVNSFTIDRDSNAVDTIALTFGETLGKKLSYNIAQNTFNFNANLQVEGNLTVTGLINGVNLSSLQSSTGALKASSGGGLNLNVSFGGYRLNGNITNYVGGTIALAPNATNYVFFGSGGLAKNSTGFPTDESFIPVAQVTTSAGSIQAVTDRRTLQSDDRERTVLQTYTAAFEKASYQGDGADNIGQLSISHDNITQRNFYVWSSTRGTLQDYDIILMVPVSTAFVRWRTDGSNYPLSFNYRSTSSNATDNRLDISVFDTNGVPVTLVGSASSLVSTSWATTSLRFSGSPTWTPGQDMMIRLKVSAKSEFQMQVGSLKLQYVDLGK